MGFCEGIAKIDYSALAAFIAALTAAVAVIYGAIHSANVARNNQILAAKTEMAKLKEKWLYDLRKDSGDMIAAAFLREDRQFHSHINTILLRLGQNDDNKDLRESLSKVAICYKKNSNDGSTRDALHNFQQKARNYYDDQWTLIRKPLDDIYNAKNQ